MPSYECIEVAIDEAVASVTLNRPKKLNALSDQLMTELTSALDDIAKDDKIRVVVLTGAGRAFCSGFDVTPRAVPRSTIQEWREHVRIGIGAMKRIWTLPQPVVAKVRGACVGGGFDLALCCDLTVASEDAFFGEPEVKWGGGAMFMVLPWLLQIKHVNELLLLGRTMPAKRAYELGIVNEIVAPEALDQHVTDMAKHLATMPAGTLARNKDAVHRMCDMMGMAEGMLASEDLSTLRLASRSGEGKEFQEYAAKHGLKAAFEWRDKKFGEKVQPT